MAIHKCSILVMVPGKPDRHEAIDFDTKKTFDEQLKPWLGDCYTEHVLVSRGGKIMDMFVDENGHARGLPVNPSAMNYYPGTIVGPAVLFLDRRVWR